MANTQIQMKSIFTDVEKVAAKGRMAFATSVFKGAATYRSDALFFQRYFKEDAAQCTIACKTPQNEKTTAARTDDNAPRPKSVDILEGASAIENSMSAKVSSYHVMFEKTVGGVSVVLMPDIMPSEEEVALASSTRGGDALVIVQQRLDGVQPEVIRVDTPEKFQEAVLEALPEDMPEAGVKVAYAEKEAPKTMAAAKPMGSAQELSLMGVKDLKEESAEALVKRLHGGDLHLPQGQEEEGHFGMGGLTSTQRAMPFSSAILHSAMQAAKNALKEEHKLLPKMVRDFKVDVATARGNVQVNLKFEEGHTHIRILTDSSDLRRQFEQDRESLKQLVAQFKGQGETTISFEMQHQDTPQEQDRTQQIADGSQKNLGDSRSHEEGYYLGNEGLGEMRAWARDNHDGMYVDII